ncbi:type IV toxin-antitoxin system AbiEi family antitoxin domain-containing protein [Kribbella sandramycini]|uniref:Type IV toxin-antitoxin system AbiEi family antitoxin domain-containing protein n=1 Tax=Kribbella sandramycini TaxID=60450 RepID=A0A7Y4NZE2_9ACTN|nr:type IV toxin-antitoxin system AbiEi family antitoxin domain-containing protein [Kribbella sandramycini]MBB6569405.1 very-short-patch-repair endonuclease [Kribbella sandramycini]NOL40758.1 type IV toxin-antitoxin system AbiEi family antitoxin domain-containing protein [Kribbella sandramycini]
MNPQLRQLAARQGGVFSSRQAASTGYSHEEIRARLVDGRWERLRHGQYAERVSLEGVPVWEREIRRHRMLVHAAVNSMKPLSAVVSHHSALVLHGAPVWQAELQEVQLTRTTGRSGESAGVRHHRGLLDDSDVTRLDGVLTTSIVRAMAEYATRSSFEAAVVSADAALRQGGVSDVELHRVLTAAENWAGAPKVRAVLAFASPLAESVGESRLRVLMRNHGLPDPELQISFADAEGLIGRVDFFFRSEATVVEFDGALKYTDDSQDALFKEKIREDRLRAMGLQVVRIRWADLDRDIWTAHSIRQAFARSSDSRIAG